MLSLLFLLLATALACGGGKAPLSPSPLGLAATIKNFSFSPNPITIDRGTRVAWTNRDSVRHTVTGEGFGSGQLGQGESFSQTFLQPGSYSYHCSFHPNMKGTVEVR